MATGQPDAEQKRRRNAEAEAAIMRRLDEIDTNTARLLDLYQRGLAIDKIANRLDALGKEKAALQISLQELRLIIASGEEKPSSQPYRSGECMGIPIASTLLTPASDPLPIGRLTPMRESVFFLVRRVNIPPWEGLYCTASG